MFWRKLAAVVVAYLNIVNIWQTFCACWGIALVLTRGSASVQGYEVVKAIEAVGSQSGDTSEVRLNSYISFPFLIGLHNRWVEP